MEILFELLIIVCFFAILFFFTERCVFPLLDKYEKDNQKK